MDEMRESGPSIQFRPFQEGDIGLLGPWLEEAGLGAPPWLASETWGYRLMHDPRILCLSALACADVPEPDVVAFLRLDIAPDRAAEVTLIVSPRRRRQGVGAQLLARALDEARRMRLRRLIAVVKESNRIALALFAAWGFEVTAQSMPGHVHLERLIHSAEHQPPLEINP